MAGEGRRFLDEGYQVHKPAVMTVDRHTGREMPMVVCAVKDLPGVEKYGSNLIFIERTFHKTDGVEDAIKKEFPNAKFIAINELTEGQACTCLLAENEINGDGELLIAGCDNGMVFDESKFIKEKAKTDCLVFTYRNNEAVLANPDAYGWMLTDCENNITGISIKKAISAFPLNDHAVVATFWFKNGRIFIEAAKKMIAENDKINGEFYVDEVVKHIIELGYRSKVFEIDRYLCWGTPKDYENYMQTMKYWMKFIHNERYL